MTGRLMTFEERVKDGQYMVPIYHDAHGKQSTQVGGDYVFNFLTYKVLELCKGEFYGFCWIGVK